MRTFKGWILENLCFYHTTPNKYLLIWNRISSLAFFRKDTSVKTKTAIGSLCAKRDVWNSVHHHKGIRYTHCKIQIIPTPNTRTKCKCCNLHNLQVIKKWKLRIQFGTCVSSSYTANTLANRFQAFLHSEGVSFSLCWKPHEFWWLTVILLRLNRAKKRSWFCAVSNTGPCNTKVAFLSTFLLRGTYNQSQFMPKQGFDGHAKNNIYYIHTLNVV